MTVAVAVDVAVAEVLVAVAKVPAAMWDIDAAFTLRCPGYHGLLTVTAEVVAVALAAVVLKRLAALTKGVASAAEVMVAVTISMAAMAEIVVATAKVLAVSSQIVAQLPQPVDAAAEAAAKVAQGHVSQDRVQGSGVGGCGHSQRVPCG